MPSATAPYAAFRLNFEQQQKRAKDFLKQLNANDAAAWQRLQQVVGKNSPYPADVKLATAQFCIARELRFANWAALKQHINAMQLQQTQLTSSNAVLDGDLRTMHIRCGHDIQQTLKTAGFQGDFNLHINPYLEGPVTNDPHWLAQRARYICTASGAAHNLTFEEVFAACQAEEQRLLAASRGDYQRVVLWLEHDRYDQFVLLRCLAWFAEHGAPATIELVGPNDFPGCELFRGLGQLPPEALRLLWQQRKPITPPQLQFAHAVWQDFRAPNPENLAELVRSNTLILPDLALALRRHLQELPSPFNGLGLTQQILLQTLAMHGPIRAGQLVGLVIHNVDPLPGLGDSSYNQHLREMAALPEPLVLREGDHPFTEWHLDRLTITDAGLTLLAGNTNWLALAEKERWVGGVCIKPRQQNWHWDDKESRVNYY